MTTSNPYPRSSTFTFPRRGLGLAIGALAALLGLAGLAQARPWGHGAHRGGFFGRGMMHMVGDLDLTEQQELEAVRMRRAVREEGQAMKKAMVADAAAAAEEMKLVNPDRDKLHGLVDGAIERFRKMAHSTVDRVLDFHAKLSPEQKAKVSEHIVKRQARMDKWRERMNDE